MSLALHNVNIARDWLSQGTSPFLSRRSRVFDQLEIGLTRVKPGVKKNAQFFARLVKKNSSV